MKHEITNFSAHKTAKVFAAIYGLMALCILPFMLFGLLSGQKGALAVGMIVMLVAYPVLGYVVVGLGCLTYNFVAGHVGGIEFETEDEPA